MSIPFSGTVLFLAGVGDLGIKYDSAFSDFTLHNPLAALKPNSNKQEGSLRAKSQLGNSGSIPPSSKARKQTSWSLTQHYQSFKSTTSQSAVWLFVLLDCKLMVLTGLFYVLPSDLLALWAVQLPGAVWLLLRG